MVPDNLALNNLAPRFKSGQYIPRKHKFKFDRLLHILQGKVEIISIILIQQNVARRSNVAGLLCVIEGFILPTNPPGHWGTEGQPEKGKTRKVNKSLTSYCSSCVCVILAL